MKASSSENMRFVSLKKGKASEELHVPQRLINLIKQTHPAIMR
jgi:hypothetical protein